MESLGMGGYGAYVWSSFLITFAVLVTTALQARARHYKLLREIKLRIIAMEAQQ